MVRATRKHTPKRTFRRNPPKAATSSPWLLFQPDFERVHDRAGSTEQALAAFETILHSSVPSLEQKVSFNGEKICRVRHADFWENSAYPWIETDVSGVDHLRVHYTEYDPSLPAESGDFYIQAAGFERELERLYPAPAPAPPSKKPTPKKKPRKAKQPTAPAPRSKRRKTRRRSRRGPQNNPSIAASPPSPPPPPLPVPQTTVGAEARAITHLTPMLKLLGDAMSKSEARAECKQFNISGAGFRYHVWPTARERAGLERKAPPGKKRRKPAEIEPEVEQIIGPKKSGRKSSS